MKKINIALILGGTSSEREISKMSGKGVYNALLKLSEYNVKIIDPAYGENQSTKPDDYFGPDYAPISNNNFLKTFTTKLFDGIDLAFIMLHGKYGEDGFIQNILEMKGIPFTGAPAFSCAVAMEKIASKMIFDSNKIGNAPWFYSEKGKESLKDIIDKIHSNFGFPCVVKPNSEGSSIGMAICKCESDVIPALETAFKYSERVILEKFISGREIQVAVLGEQVLPPIEIKPKHEYYDYECKYTKGMTEYIVPADLPDDLVEKINIETLKVVEALGSKGFPRVDFRLDENNNLYCLELNSLPGMTETSLVPKMAKAVGIEYEELVDIIIKLALNKK